MTLQESEKHVQRASWYRPAILIGAFAVIIINLIIVWYFLIHVPSSCAKLSELTNGHATCENMPGAYVVVGAAVMIIAASCVLVYRLYRPKM